MHSNNDKKGNNDEGRLAGNGRVWIPSSRYEKYSGPNKEIREQHKKYLEEKNKSNTQFSNTNAGSSQGNSR